MLPNLFFLVEIHPIYIKPSINLSILESYNFSGIIMVLRELSNQELSQLAWHTIHYFIKVGRGVEEENLKTAFYTTVANDKLASSKVTLLNDRYIFESIKPESVPFHSEFVDDFSEKSEKYDIVVNSHVPVHDYQVKMNFFKYKSGSTIVLSLAHSIASGRAGVDFISNILREYDCLVTDKISFSDSFDVPRPLSYYAKLKSTKIMDYVDVSESGKACSSIPIMSAVDTPRDLNTKFVDINVTEKDYSKLVETCKVNGVSVNSYLSACQIRAVYESFCEKDCEKPLTHNLSIDMRKKVNDANFGGLVHFSHSGMMFMQPSDLDCVWSLSKNISSWLERYLISERIWASINKIESLDLTVHDLNSPILDDTLNWTSCNSNLGVIDFKEFSDTIPVEGFNFIVNRINGSHLAFISTLNDTLSIRYAFSEPHYNNECMEKLTINFKKQIINGLLIK